MLFDAAGEDRLTSLEAALDSGESELAAGARLRASGLPGDEVAALLAQAGLRRRARGKFGDAARRMLFTPAGLEQASRSPVAALHARRFSDAGCRVVADRGCGIGTESLALLAEGVDVLAVEIDPLTARVAERNLSAALRPSAAPVAGSDSPPPSSWPRADRPEPSPSAAAESSRPSDSPPAELPRPPSRGLGSGCILGSPGFTVIAADATSASLDGVDGVFLDPARRTSGHSDTRRLARPDDYSPSLDFAFGLAERLPTGIKLGPGFDRELIPPTAEAQWVSVDGQLVEMGLWFGSAARPGVRRAALVLRSDRSSGSAHLDRLDERNPCSHEEQAPSDRAAVDRARRDLGRYSTHELTADDDALDAEVRGLGEYLYEPDGAVIRARLIGLLASRLGAGMLSEGIAYLSADAPVPTPFAQCFRVLEQLPAREKQLKRALAERGIGRLEIKKRGVDVDPAALRTRLRLKGSNSATLILTRVAGRHTALLVERV